MYFEAIKWALGIALDHPGISELVALVSDEQFAEEPLNVSDIVAVR